MILDSASIANFIQAALPRAVIQIDDLRGDGAHYALYVAAPDFAGKTRVEQHQMVYAALKGHWDTGLQALTLQTSTAKE